MEGTLHFCPGSLYVTEKEYPVDAFCSAKVLKSVSTPTDEKTAINKAGEVVSNDISPAGWCVLLFHDTG